MSANRASTGSARPSTHWSRLAWAPAPLLLAAVIAARGSGLNTPHPADGLRLALSTVFYTVVAVSTLALIGRTFLAAGRPALLFFGGGVLFWGLAGTLGDALWHGDANVNVTVFNAGILFSGLCHLAGAVSWARWRRELRLKAAWLVLTCALALGLLLVVTQTAIAHRLPVFFVPGHGGTPVRHGVLVSAIALFVLSASLLYSGGPALRSRFIFWYANAMLLMAVGLFGVMIQLQLSSTVNWLARSAQWLGGAYLLAAAIVGRRERPEALVPTAAELRGAHYADAMALVLVLAATALRLAFLQALGTSVPFLLYFPAVMLAALYGGRRAGLLSTLLSTLAADYFWIHPLGDLFVFTRDDLVTAAGFFLSCVMMSLVAEAMRRAQARAREAETRAQIAAARQQDLVALRISEEKFSTLFYASPVPMALTTVPGALLHDANRAWLDLLGFAHRDEVVGKSTVELGLMREPGVRQDILERFRQQGFVRDAEISAHTRTGRALNLLFNLHTVTLAGSQFTLATIQDITERRRVEDDRVRGQALLEATFSAMTDGITVYDADGTIVRTNKAALALYGIDPVGTNAMTLTQHLSCRRLDGRSLLSGELPISRALGGETVTGERFTLRDVSGRDVVVETSSTPLRIGGKVVGAVSAWHDVTDSVRSHHALVEADRRKNEFLATLSHELRNPLAPIRNSLYIIARATPGGEQARRAFAVLERQVSQLARLVDDLLDVTRVSRNKIRLQRRLLELNELVERTLDDHRSLFDEAEIQLEWVPSAVPVLVNGDGNRLAQVVGNLLTNAAKFTSAGGRTTVSVALDHTGHRSLIRVADTGMGMDEHTIAGLFQPFVQAEKTLDRSRGGLGLGLALVKGLVELHDGSIEAHSDGPGRGAEFVVSLPFADEDRTVSTAPLPAAPSHRRRVLVIEDNVDAANSLREALELADHQVEVAYCGREGLEKARRFNPEIVLCDIGLPAMDGYEVARAFRADRALRSAFLVALSGYALPEDLRRAAEAGFQHHVSKPPDIGALEELLRTLPGSPAELDLSLA